MITRVLDHRRLQDVITIAMVNAITKNSVIEAVQAMLR